MRVFTLAAAAIALLIAAAFAPAYSQQEEKKGPPTARTDADKKNDSEIDRAYRATIKATDTKGQAPAKVDPWHTVRPAAPDKAKP